MSCDDKHKHKPKDDECDDHKDHCKCDEHGDHDPCNQAHDCEHDVECPEHTEHEHMHMPMHMACMPMHMMPMHMPMMPIPRPSIVYHYHFFIYPRPISPITPPPPVPPQPQCRWYIVQPGDTMWRIAQRFNLPLATLIAANPQIPNPNLIYPGQRICIPLLAVVPLPTVPPVTAPITTLPAPVPMIPPITAPLMPIPAPVPMIPPTTAPIMPIPAPVPMIPPTTAPFMPIPAPVPMIPPTALIPAPIPTIPPTTGPIMPPIMPTVPAVPAIPPTVELPLIGVTPSGQCTWYTVKAGDTMYKIAQMNNIPLNTLIAANPQISNPNMIMPGDMICIPANVPPQPGCQTTYTVKPGDTMYKIAQTYHLSLNTLIAANPQISNPSMIMPGDMICIPADAPPQTGCKMTYTVKPGDTMYKIAQANNIPLNTLIAANPQISNPNMIMPGDMICIPR